MTDSEEGREQPRSQRVPLPLIFGVDGIWYSIVVAEVMAVTISALFLVGKRKCYQYY